MPKALYQTRREREEKRSVPVVLTIPDSILVRTISEFVPIEEILKKNLFAIRNFTTYFDILKFAIVAQEMTPNLRRNFWLHFCGKTNRILRMEGLKIDPKIPNWTRERVFLYYLRATRRDDAEAEIERDVVRTMPHHFLFSSNSPIGAINRGKLKSVLFAVSSAEPSVGYCQGMNFVVATLLIHLQMDESDAFFMFLSILRDYHFQYLYSPAVPQLPLRLFHFSRVVRAHVPSVWHHLNAKTFSVEIFANQWIMTLYAYYLGPDVLEKIWTLFFLLGWKYLFQIGATILSLLEKRIVQMDVEEISAFMQTARKDQIDHPFGDPETLQHQLWLSVTRFPISTKDLEMYTQQFLTEKLLHVIRSKISLEVTVIGFSLVDSFLKIDLSCFTAANRPHEQPNEFVRYVQIPIQSVSEIGKSVEFVAASFSKETGRITTELGSIEKNRLSLGKQFNSLLNQVSRMDEALKKVATAKITLSEALRDSVTVPPIEGGKAVTELLAIVVETEQEFSTKKSARDKLNLELANAEKKLKHLSIRKEELVLELSRNVTESENAQNEIVYRCIQSAIDSFGSSDHN